MSNGQFLILQSGFKKSKLERIVLLTRLLHNINYVLKILTHKGNGGLNEQIQVFTVRFSHSLHPQPDRIYKLNSSFNSQRPGSKRGAWQASHLFAHAAPS